MRLRRAAVVHRLYHGLGRSPLFEDILIDTQEVAVMWKAAFWKDAAERAIRTFAQTFGALVVAAGTGLLGTDWLSAFSAAGMAALLSVLTSLASEVKSPNGTASMIDAPEPVPAVEPGVPG